MPSARKGPARGARGADAPDTVAAPVNIKAQVVEGVAWKIAAQIVSALSRLVVGVILARLLTRDAFGVAGMALVIAAFAGVGRGRWAIIGMTLAAEATSVIVLWGASPWRPRFIYSLVSLRDTGRFGIKLFGASILSYLSLNGDNLLIGRFIGSVALGT